MRNTDQNGFIITVYKILSAKYLIVNVVELVCHAVYMQIACGRQVPMSIRVLILNTVHRII